jgi:putative oxidoreductase
MPAHRGIGRMPLGRRLLSIDTEEPLSQAGLVGLRIIAGLLVATLHGWHKVVQGWQYLAAGTDWPLLHDTVQLGFPSPIMFATLAALSQFVGGWLMALGAWTRVAAFLVASTMFTAMMFNLRTGGPDAQLAGLYCLVSGAFVLIGSGRWSVDRRAQRPVVIDSRPS